MWSRPVGGLHRDLPRVLDRRRAIQWMGGVSLAGLLAACGSSDTTAAAEATIEPTTSPTTPVVDSMDASAGVEIPDETAGSYPADGSDGPNVSGEDGIVRSDLATSIGSLSGTAEGVPTNIQLDIVDASTGDAMPGAAVYLWHCTAAGEYSMYEITDQNYLRGVQVADDAGRVAFTTIFPGCYAGRWPNGAVNLSQLSLATDNVFRDGWVDQLATVAGNADEFITASLLVRL